MGIFKKQIDERAFNDFFVMAYTKILSPEEQLRHTNQLHLITKSAPILQHVTQQVFNEHLNAVNMAWLNIAWSKYYAVRVNMLNGIDLMLKLETHLKSALPGFTECNSLADFYSDTFGGSADGNTDMAWVFVRNILRDFDQTIAKQNPQDFNSTLQSFSYLFLGTYDTCRDNIKSHHIIH
jgi:hypothetical protein